MLIERRGQSVRHAVIKRHMNYWGKLFYFINRKGWGESRSAAHLSYWRKLIFTIYYVAYYNVMSSFLDFFLENSLMLLISRTHLSLLEQTTRKWFYYKSTIKERTTLSKKHFSFLQSQFSRVTLKCIYLRKGIVLWKQQYQDNTISLKLCYDRYYRKEGLLAVAFNLGEQRIYSISFWIAPNEDGEMSIWIGTLQGLQGNSQGIHDLTKYFCGYRPKNLMIYTIRTLAHILQIKRIYAVSNYGSYVNQRIRNKRKLKTSLDEFWKETGGVLCSDLRFFELPLIEQQKNLEEVNSRKRNLYRKRFALLDTIHTLITTTLQPYLR